MLRLIPLLWRKREFASAACIAVSFWALAVLVHIQLQGGVIEPLVLGAMLLCCLLLPGFVSFRRWKSLGTSGVLFLAASASYLVIAIGVSLATDSELIGKDVLRQVFFFLVALAAMLGGRWLLERIGAETLLTWTLVILVASCAVVLASPLLRDIGVLPEYRHPYRMTGTFSDPNDAGFIACMTAVLALAFQSNGRRRPLGYLALVLGCAAGFASFSFTAIIVLGGMLIVFLLLNVRRLGQDLLHTGLIVLCVAGVLVMLIPGTPVVNTRQAWIVDAHETKRVGDTITVFLVNNKPHRADNIPVNSWRWQRADARPGNVDTPDDATWTDIEGVLSPDYVPSDEDGGRFLRAYAFHEKNGATHRVRTEVIGPIMAASTATATDASAPAHPLKEAGGTGEALTSKGDSSNSNGGVLPRRILLWEMGFDKVLESPIVGHGLYHLHYMEGAPARSRGTHRESRSAVHNMYLMLVGEAGVVPLALYLLSLFFLIRLLWTVPKSLGRDLVVGWVITWALHGLSSNHLLNTGIHNFVIGLTCATAAFLVQRQRDPTAA